MPFAFPVINLLPDLPDDITSLFPACTVAFLDLLCMTFCLSLDPATCPLPINTYTWNQLFVSHCVHDRLCLQYFSLSGPIPPFSLLLSFSSSASLKHLPSLSFSITLSIPTFLSLIITVFKHCSLCVWCVCVHMQIHWRIAITNTRSLANLTDQKTQVVLQMGSYSQYSALLLTTAHTVKNYFLDQPPKNTSTYFLQKTFTFSNCNIITKLWLT